MNKEQLIKQLLKQYTYKDNDDILSYDSCGNCGLICLQRDYDGSFGCEHCDSENININEVEE